MAWRPRLKPSVEETLHLVVEYLEGRGRDCFTYRGLRAYVLYDRPRRPSIDWHTIERSVRDLVGYGFLRRIERRSGRRRKVLFCKGPMWSIATSIAGGA